MSTLLSKISEIQSNLTKEMKDLCMRVESNSKEIKLLEETLTTELSRFHVNEEEKIPYVFIAPPRNRYFSGRTGEIQDLKRILEIDDTFEQKKVRKVAAVCGLGGVGKTSLVSEYAHLMKDYYKGGVYWFSAEDDTFLDKTVNDIALSIGALLGSFDLTLSNTLRKISNTPEPSLIVLDCLDQYNLSSNMTKFLSFPSRENIFGHFLVLTRRKPKLLVNEISILEKESCLQLKCFLSYEAKQFLFSRTCVTRDEDVEIVAENICEELGGLPLALEQAGACIEMLSCSLSSYLEQFQSERLRLLSQQSARPVSPGNESSERLAVHTTWRLNMEYMKKSQNGQVAVRFMNACTFFNANEIEQELINVGTPEVEDVAFRQCAALPLGAHQILKPLTDFSLFTFVNAHSVSTHRLVQELVRESLNPESKVESFVDAVRMLSYALSKRPSFVNRLGSNDSPASPKSPSHFYMWSKLCMHGHSLRRHLEQMLVTFDSVSLDPVWSSPTAMILYECAVHLSANHKQGEAKSALNFAYRILDWLPLADYETVKNMILNDSLFPLSIPLPNSFQIEIKHCSAPPFFSIQSLTPKPETDVLDLGDLNQKIEKLKLDGNQRFKEGHYKEAVVAYSSAIALSRDSKNALNPFLLIDRATVYIKVRQFEDALKDANEYITSRPDCWRGYARKALALDGLNEKVSSEIAAALAFYHDRNMFLDFLPFQVSFVGLQERIFICDTVDELLKAITLPWVETDGFKILVLGSQEYILNSCSIDKAELRINLCICVGTRNDCSSCLKLTEGIYLYKCMITNLSFYVVKGQVLCVLGSFVKVLNCNFTSDDDEVPTVATSGDLNVEKCNFINSKVSGLICEGPGVTVVNGCSFSNNGSDGVGVRGGGMLIVKSSRMSSNGRNGLKIGPGALECAAIDCKINHNGARGIIIENSTNITLERNDVFGNDNHGLAMTNSHADIGENNFFDNGFWGIWSQCNSWCNISMNKVFRNKLGGIRVGYRAAGVQFSPSFVRLNQIHDNLGPGFLENVNKFEVDSSEIASEDLKKTYLESPNSLQRAKCAGNEVYKNKESANVGKFSVPYCSNCRMKRALKKCGKCFTASYCKTTCQENHWSKHKKICKILRKKSSILIEITELPPSFVEEVLHPKEIGPTFNPPPPRDGRFLVKVFSEVQSDDVIYDNSLITTLLLHDRSLELYGSFDSKRLYKLVKEFGVLLKRKCNEKKLFFYCLLEKSGQLRLFLNEFPEFQNW